MLKNLNDERFDKWNKDFTVSGGKYASLKSTMGSLSITGSRLQERYSPYQNAIQDSKIDSLLPAANNNNIGRAHNEIKASDGSTINKGIYQ